MRPSLSQMDRQMTYTQVLMSTSAILLATFGIGATFLPQEILQWLGATPSAALSQLVQLAGALYLGFAVLNWMLRHQLIGGIYNRPVVLANLLHFVSAAIGLVKTITSAPEAQVLWPAALTYGIFALAFGAVLFRHPVRSPVNPVEQSA